MTSSSFNTRPSRSSAHLLKGLVCLWACCLAAACGGPGEDVEFDALSVDTAQQELLNLAVEPLPPILVRNCSLNLKLDSVQVTDSAGAPTNSCYSTYWLKMTVRNAGTCSTGNVGTKLYVDGYYQIRGYIDVPALSPGQSRSFSVNWRPTAASVPLRQIHVDHTSLVAESNESDNFGAYGCNWD